MASRYSAFALADEAYLLRTWDPGHRPASITFDPARRWTGLEILAARDGGPFHTQGTVEFRAHYTDHGRPGSQHEVSRFARHEGRWVYVEAQGPQA